MKRALKRKIPKDTVYIPGLGFIKAGPDAIPLKKSGKTPEEFLEALKKMPTFDMFPDNDYVKD